MSIKGKPTQSAPQPLLKNTAAAPVVYFDSVPAVGIFAGNFEMELACRVLLPSRDGVNVTSDLVCQAHLRCSPAAARLLVETASRLLASMPKPEEAEVTTEKTVN